MICSVTNASQRFKVLDEDIQKLFLNASQHTICLPVVRRLIKMMDLRFAPVELEGHAVYHVGMPDSTQKRSL